MGVNGYTSTMQKKKKCQMAKKKNNHKIIIICNAIPCCTNVQLKETNNWTGKRNNKVK